MPAVRGSVNPSVGSAIDSVEADGQHLRRKSCGGAWGRGGPTARSRAGLVSTISRRCSPLRLNEGVRESHELIVCRSTRRP